jgi:hypothetical protein
VIPLASFPKGTFPEICFRLDVSCETPNNNNIQQ